MSRKRKNKKVRFGPIIQLEGIASILEKDERHVVLSKMYEKAIHEYISGIFKGVYLDGAKHRPTISIYETSEKMNTEDSIYKEFIDYFKKNKDTTTHFFCNSSKSTLTYDPNSTLPSTCKSCPRCRAFNKVFKSKSK